ncbi:hypothetical protein BM523_16085 [Alteromonas mediterranea]|uniref:hypothetical protein n=1 Tax=Alteromonas mediterranea TaxID=314275 RepID=UPI0009039193|nr:hypothetical protein [Alteromonas mediterranea]APD95388.1 hypothetical protein BM523_16085 [Alteromonas mediterranea]APD99022.1 hypothetical protein BM525_16105 [Alteromonas mediterranea]
MIHYNAKLTGHLVSGFAKVLSVIETNETYDKILGQKINKLDYKSIMNEAGKVSSGSAIDFLINKTSEISVHTLIPPSYLPKNGFLTFASTANNLREIEFLENIVLLEGNSIERINISEWLSSQNKVRVNTNDILFNTIKAGIIKQFSKKGEVRLSSVHQAYNYIVFFVQALYSLKNIRKNYKFVIANDHSPKQVAFTKIAEYYGRETIYIQHAEVTDNFPPLDFDWALLRNYQSKKTYAKLSPENRTNIIVADRDIGTTPLIDIRDSLNEIINANSTNVIIYLSSVFCEHAVEKIYKKLVTNDDVSTVYFKLHPSTRDYSFFNNKNIPVLEKHVEYQHIAICGNSSVAVELLKKGNLVFNFFSLDNIVEDYYGFVKQGITFELKEADLDTKFWASIKIEHFSTERWSLYDPTFPSPQNIIERLKVPLISSIFFREELFEKIKDFAFDRDVFAFTSIFLRLLHASKTLYDDFYIIKRMELHFSNRNPLLNNLFRFADLSRVESVFEFWLNMKLIEWTGSVPSQEQLMLHVEYLNNFELSRASRKPLGWMENKLFDVMVRHAHPSNMLSFLKSTQILNIASLGINKRIAYYNFVKLHDNSALALKRFYDPSVAPLTILEKLKFKTQAGFASDSSMTFDNFRAAEKIFIRALPAIKDEFLVSVGAFYDKIDSRARFVDVKYSEKERQDFVSLVIAKLCDEKGFSFIRLSDGEGFIFHNDESLFDLNDSKNRQRHWWGTELPPPVEVDLRSDLISSVKNADVLGVPSIYRFIRDHSDKSISLKQNLQGRGLLTVLDGVAKIDNENILYADDKLNIAVLNNIGIIEYLASYAKKVIIINSGSLNAMNTAFGDSFEFVHIQIPTHFKTATNLKYKNTTRPLPFVYKSIESKLANECVPGSLVLVGAGVAGKSFMNIAKKHKSVGLDLGSAMDQYIGGEIHSLF